MRNQVRIPESISFAIGVAVALLLVPGWSRAASLTELRAYGSEGPYGGCTTCGGQSADRDIPNAVFGDVASFSLSNLGGDLSYADSIGVAGFGYLNAYADAHRTYNTSLSGTYMVGDAQAGAQTEFIDYLLPGASSPVGYASYMLTLAITGSHTSQDSSYPDNITAEGFVSWDIRNNRTGDVYAHGTWTSTDLNPQTLLHIPVGGVAPNDLMRLDVGLDAFAYVMSNNINPANLTAFADYSHTLVASLDAVTPGASTLGVSGHDYATSAPEPGSFLLLLPAIGMLIPRARRWGRLQL